MEIMGLCNPILWFGVLFAFGIITIPAYAKYRLGGGSKLFRSLFTIMMVFIPFLYMALALTDGMHKWPYCVFNHS